MGKDLVGSMTGRAIGHGNVPGATLEAVGSLRYSRFFFSRSSIGFSFFFFIIAPFVKEGLVIGKVSLFEASFIQLGQVGKE